MKKPLYLTIILFALTAFIFRANAQHKGTVKAQIVDTKNVPIELATASILGADSTLVRTTATDKNGMLNIEGLSFGRYRLMVSQLGLQHKMVSFTLSAEKPVVDLGKLEMQVAVHALNQVDVVAEKAPVTIKQDTTEFNASSFKTQKNDNVEALLKKLPGVDVDKDGKITAQGQQVKKVLVDGKEFFGNDPKAATRNLPADAVKTVQVIDDKTDKAKNTGIDDGQREKVMNVTLKDDKKSGWFGNITGASGNSDRYLGQFNLNHFDTKRQLSFLFLSNNVNESGFSFEDLNNFAGNGLFDMFAGGGGGITINMSNNGRVDINGAFSGVGGGLITSHSGGVNYSDEFAKGKLKFNVSTLSILTRNTVARTSDIQDLPNNLFTNQLSSGNNTSNSYRLNFSLDYKLDSLTSFKLKPVFSTTYKKNYSSLASGTIDQLADSVNSIRQLFDQTMHSPAVGGQFTFNRKLHNNKGSLNFFMDGNYSASNADYTNHSNTFFYQGTQPNSNLNQLASQDADVSYLNGTASFVRQLNSVKRLSLTMSQGFNLQKQNATQNTLDYNPVTGNYEILNPLYSGLSDNHSHRYTSTVGLSKTNDKFTINVNMALAELGLSGYSNANNAVNNVSREAWALTPSASFNLRKGKSGRYAYISVGSDVSLPSATDLQTVFTNTNPLYIRQGNPDLQMSRSFYVSGNFSRFNQKSNAYINVFANYNTTYNGFSTASTVVGGVTTSKPINVDGNYSLTFGTSVGKPTHIKGLKFNTGIYANINRSINMINDNRNAVTRISPNVNAGVSFDRDKFQTSINTSVNYNNAKNSYQSAADRHYWAYNNRMSASVLPVKTLRIFSDVTQSLYRGQPASANTTYYLWNAGIERYFLKGQNLTLSLNAFDLLDQNSGIQRSVTQLGAIQNNQTNTIGRYFYLKLIYKITKVGGGPTNRGSGIVIGR